MKKKARKNNTLKIFLITAILIVLVIGTYFIINAFYITEQIIRIPVDMRIPQIPNEIGFNVDNDALHFGSVPENSCATRTFNVTNNRDYEIRILLEKQGNTSAFLTLDNYDFYLKPKDVKLVKAKACVPIGASKGNYTGTLVVNFRKF